MRKGSKIQIFENLTFSFLPLAFVMKNFGRQIFYIQVSSRLKGFPWLSHVQRRWGIKKALEQELDHRTEVACHYEALQTIEDVYQRQFESHGLMKALVTGFQSEKIHLAYKKVLLEELHKFYRMKAALKEISRDFHGQPITFIPRDFLTVQDWIQRGQNRKEIVDLPENIVIPLWARGYCLLMSLLRKLKWVAGFGVFPLWIISRIRKIHWHSEPMKDFQIGIRIYKTDFGFRFPYRRIDFLLDGRKIHRTNTLFCVETQISPEYRRQLQEKSYKVVDLPTILRSVSVSFLLRVLLKDFLSLWLRVGKDIFLAPPFLIKTTLKNWRTYLTWKRFMEEFSMKHLVVYNDFGEQHVLRNLVLAQHQTETWYYLHSRNSDDVFAPESERDQHVFTSFSYLSYDNFVRWSRNIENYYKPHCIRKFLDLGCLWSEHIRLINERPDFDRIRENYKRKTKVRTHKIMAVFDTTFGFGDGYVLQPQDMILFTEDILRLLMDVPDTLVIFKEKNIRGELEAEYPQVLAVYEKLGRHPRCYFTGWSADAAEINAVSDLSITACFSSTTLEALGARKKAIYYDPNGRLRRTYYDKFPNLVAHSYEELVALVRYYLYEISQEAFHRWIDEVIVDEVDAFADGHAITRMRDLLTGPSATEFCQDCLGTRSNGEKEFIL